MHDTPTAEFFKLKKHSLAVVNGRQLAARLVCPELGGPP